MTPNQLANVSAKAERFADFLSAHLGDALDLEQVKLWNDAEWRTVTDLKNSLHSDGVIDSPPQSSRSAIVAVLRERQRDPWEGLPS